MTGIVRCGFPFRDLDGTARLCEVIAGHIGSHQNFGLKIPRKCNAQHGSWGCVKLDGHDGPHSDDGDEWEFPEPLTERPKPPVPCGLLITWYGTGSDTCALRAGHRGLHSSGPGDYIGGRTTEDVLVEAFQRISELEARIRKLEPGADTPATEESVDRAMGVLERRITDRLSGIESLIRDVSAKVSQQCDGYFGLDEDSEQWRCHRAVGHDGWHSDADSGSLWDDSGTSLMAPAGQPPRKVCGDVRVSDKVGYFCQRDPGHGGSHRDAAKLLDSSLSWDRNKAWKTTGRD